jgi:predicted RecB family nuclease
MRNTDGQLQLAATDLSNFLACRHLTRLDTLKSEGRLSPAKQFDIGFQDLIQRGEAHEKRVLGLLAEEDRVTEIPTTVEITDTEKSRLTADAMTAGVDVIYQGVLLLDHSSGIRLLGRPDFLVRADLPRLRTGPDEAAVGYEIVDAKLARTAKARAVLQSVFYSYLLSQVQGAVPEQLHLALGHGEFVRFRTADFAAYERRIRSYLEDFLLEDVGDYPDIEPYPEPVEHCAICRWRADCTKKRRDDDDLSLIAGMPTTHRVALKATGVSQRRQFAELEALPPLKGTNLDSLRRSQLQAQLQVESEDAGEIIYQLLDPDRDDEGVLVPNRGLLALPEPSNGDLFFDIEGARYYSEDGQEYGLQYLFGIVDTADLDADGMPRYTQIWSFDRDGEKVAFEELIDFVMLRRAVNPDLHVYHYNHYEPTSLDHLTELHETREEAVGRLMGRFATHEDEVDDIFRLGVFVDLYRVIRQGLRAGVESYSIKRLEKLIDFQRNIDLEDATENLIRFESALDEGVAAEDLETQRVVAGYNEDDCRATLALRHWLEARRVELSEQVGEPLQRPMAQVVDETYGDPEVARLKSLLMHGIPDEPGERSAEENAKILLGDLLEWHRREAKPAWWRFFRLRTMSSTELVDEPDAIGELAGGQLVGVEKRSTVRRFAFPPQEHGFDSGDTAEDPVSHKKWTVVAIDEEHGTIDLKIGKAAAPMPTALVEGGPISTKKLAARLCDLADQVVQSGFDVGEPATALLLRLRPSAGDLEGSPLRHDEEPATEAAQRIILGLAGSYLPIQGPPGSGKTFTAASAILELVEEGRTVGITAPSHAVIRNLIDEVVKQAARYGRSVRIGQRPDGDERFLHPSAESLDYGQIVARLVHEELDIVAGTAWLWARDEFTQVVDTLVVDEAGQFSLANALAIAGAGRNLVLLGDPQQLAQPSRGAHPPGSEVSALGHVLGEFDTMPDTAGLFLDQTYRLHPDLCRYTSEVFYDNRLEGVDGLVNQRISGTSWTLAETGLSFVEGNHQGNANVSREEAVEVVRLVRNLIGASWTDKEQHTRRMGTGDVLVVTPFNAQVREIESALAGAGFSEVRVGTVDKFQGQQAPAVVYSMASSSSADAPRGLEFLFDLHRLNVATSRARAAAVLVASRELLRVFCKTPRQMVLVNALCRAREFSAASH